MRLRVRMESAISDEMWVAALERPFHFARHISSEHRSRNQYAVVKDDRCTGDTFWLPEILVASPKGPEVPYQRVALSQNISSVLEENAYHVALLDIEPHQDAVRRIPQRVRQNQTIGSMAELCTILREVGENPNVVSAIVDPGDSIDHLLGQIIAYRADVRYVFITHRHLDHIIGVAPLYLALREIARVTGRANYRDPVLVVGNSNTIEELRRPVKRTGSEIQYMTTPEGIDGLGSIRIHTVAGQEILPMQSGNAQVRFDVSPIPGHTDDSLLVRFKLGKRTYIFTGDSVFAGEEGRFRNGGVNWPNSVRELMATSVSHVVEESTLDSIYLPGHGRDTQFRHEREGLLAYIQRFGSPEDPKAQKAIRKLTLDTGAKPHSVEENNDPGSR